MEKVIWLMYLADLCDGVSLIGFFALIAFSGAASFVVVGGAFGDEDVRRQLWRHSRWLLIPVVIAAFCPNAKTVRLLAAVSAGEAAVSTTLGAKGLEAVNAVLDRVIETAKKDATKGK